MVQVDGTPSSVWNQLKMLPLRRYRSLCDVIATKRTSGAVESKRETTSPETKVATFECDRRERQGYSISMSAHGNQKAVKFEAETKPSPKDLGAIPSDKRVLLRSTKSCCGVYDEMLPTSKNKTSCWRGKKSHKVPKVEYIMLWDPEEDEQELLENEPWTARATRPHQQRCVNCSKLFFVSLAPFESSRKPSKPVARCSSLPAHLFPHKCDTSSDGEPQSASSLPPKVPRNGLWPLPPQVPVVPTPFKSQPNSEEDHHHHFCSLDCRSSFEYQRELQDLFSEQFDCEATLPTSLDEEDEEDDEEELYNFSGSELDDMN